MWEESQIIIPYNGTIIMVNEFESGVLYHIDMAGVNMRGNK
ncbi:hypothetical protein [Clostridium sp. AM58-1XD]|nr:hypothetical protein [Clostridium sp. AM58-1XD]